MTSDQSIVVIGAGAAGLAAAVRISEAGVPVVLLEARDRIGGRIFTQRDAAGDAPVELGAEFIHGVSAEILELLDKSSVEEVEGENWCVSDGRLGPCNFFSQVDDILNAMDDSGPDESFLAFLDRRFPNPSRDARLEEAKRRAIGYVSGFNAADPGLVSVHWLVAQTRAEEKTQGYRAFRSRNGYADLLDIFRRRIERSNVTLHTSTIVESIAWKPGTAQIRAHSSDGSLIFSAKQVLVTLPLPLLKTSQGTGAVQFIPPLPREKTDALEKLEMGEVVRITLRFRERFWNTIPGAGTEVRDLTEMSFLFSDDALFPTWWTTMPRKYPLITGWSTFRSARELSGQDEPAVVRQALLSLSRLLGVSMQKLEKWVDASYFHDWQSDPFSRGAYSYAKVGADGAQSIAAAPVANTLFFAGEATDTSGNNGTVHAAIATGYRAAEEILKARQGA